jgi:hypothetical protein
MGSPQLNPDAIPLANWDTLKISRRDYRVATLAVEYATEADSPSQLTRHSATALASFSASWHNGIQ